MRPQTRNAGSSRAGTTHLVRSGGRVDRPESWLVLDAATSSATSRSRGLSPASPAPRSGRGPSSDAPAELARLACDGVGFQRRTTCRQSLLAPPTARRSLFPLGGSDERGPALR